jgi:stage II sporulation SpoE-like protein
MGGRGTVWLKVLLAAGALLAFALLVQTVVTYRYVSRNLILQEARRMSQERVRNVERATSRLAHPQDPEALAVVLEDLRSEMPDQIAGIRIVRPDGGLVAASGQVPLEAAVDGPRRAAAPGGAEVIRESVEGRDVLVSVLPCRCGVSRPTGEAVAQTRDTGRLLAEVALYEDSLSAPFSSLRRNAIVSASAACALLIALGLIAIRAGAYIRGKQLEVQLDLAREVQRDLLPSAAGSPPGLDVAAEFLPASRVGGDFYDIVRLPGGRVSFVLGDVSGHGISAALLMGLIHGAMSNPPWGAEEDEPDQSADRLNRLLLAKSSGERFASLFWCSYDPASQRLRYLNAGHPPALWLRRQPDGTWSAERLSGGGPVLGLLAAAEYRTMSVMATAGDLLVLFSDGLTEAPSVLDEPFGEERLIALARATANQPARVICDAILHAVRAFTEGRPAVDDQTLLVVKLWPAGSPVDPRAVNHV